jgi:hypothetical protein
MAMNKEEKIKLVERLVNEKHITFAEGLALMETEKEYIYTQPYYPFTYPTYPTYSTSPMRLPDDVPSPLPNDYNLKPETYFNSNSPLHQPFATNYTN